MPKEREYDEDAALDESRATTTDDDWEQFAAQAEARMSGDTAPPKPDPLEEAGSLTEDSTTAELPSPTDLSDDSQDQDPESSSASSDDPARLLEAERKARESAEQQFRSANGRLAAYQSRYEKAVAELEAAKNSRASTTNLPPLKAGDLLDPAKREEIANDWPDLAPMLEAMTKTEERLAHLSEQVAASEQRTGRVVEETLDKRSKDDEYRAFQSQHENWEADIESPEFNAWLDEQPFSSARRLLSDSVDDVSALLTEYETRGSTKSEDSGDDDPVLEQIKTQRRERLIEHVTLPKSKTTARRVDHEDPVVLFEHYAKQADKRLNSLR